MNQKDKGTETG